jgi:hypothetical protein
VDVEVPMNRELRRWSAEVFSKFSLAAVPGRRGAPPVRAAVALLAAGLAACARAPIASPADDAAKTMDVPEGRALVYVYRGNLLVGPVTLPLYANAERVGELGRNTHVVLDVDPGDVRLDFPFGDGAERLVVTAEAGKRYYVHQTVHQTPLLLATIVHAKLLPVEESEGRAGLGRLLREARLPSHEERDRAARTWERTPDRARVVVIRPVWIAEATDYEVEVNGRTVGAAPARSFVVAEVPAGDVARVTVKGAGDATLVVPIPGGTEVFVAIMPHVGLVGTTVELHVVAAERARKALENLRLAADTRM